MRTRHLAVGLVGIAALLAGCDGPEAVRHRGGRGADVGNYPGLPLKIPSKIENTKDLDRFRGATADDPQHVPH